MGCTPIFYSESTVSCDITGPSTLDYGMLDINSVNGQVARLDATIQCTGAATVGLTSSSTNVSLGNGITATLKFNNGNARVNINSGGVATVQIESTLSGTNPVAGNFSGSVAVIVSVL
ncbi:MrpH family fimbial adhesin [Serratia marcescens]|uniref:MrpH family fimbial adhesin n=1 Tax=Serratia marcescens TaxID=615 RepID=UPI003EE01D2E